MNTPLRSTLLLFLLTRLLTGTPGAAQTGFTPGDLFATEASFFQVSRITSGGTFGGSGAFATLPANPSTGFAWTKDLTRAFVASTTRVFAISPTGVVTVFATVPGAEIQGILATREGRILASDTISRRVSMSLRFAFVGHRQWWDEGVLAPSGADAAQL
jgi:hypothetical protein